MYLHIIYSIHTLPLTDKQMSDIWNAQSEVPSIDPAAKCQANRLFSRGILSAKETGFDTYSSQNFL